MVKRILLLMLAVLSAASIFASDWSDVTITVYNPTVAQCDSTPLITASGKHIDIERLKQGKVRWIAVSRDLLLSYPYGTSVYVWISPGHPKNGSYIVRDTMATRWHNRIDILTYDDKYGKWEGKMQKNP